LRLGLRGFRFDVLVCGRFTLFLTAGDEAIKMLRIATRFV